MDTRTKKRPTKSDIESVNKVINEVVVSPKNAINPSETPFGFLWLVNCVVYPESVEEKRERSQSNDKI